MNIDELQAGRELDALIAERVMGWVIERKQVQDIRELERSARTVTLYTVKDGNGTKWSPCRSLDSVGLPLYSTDIAAAWTVVSKLKEAYDTHFAIDDWQFDGKLWKASFVNVLNRDRTSVFFDVANTAPLAICRAALKVVQDEH